jgi:hypothetical protein
VLCFVASFLVITSWHFCNALPFVLDISVIQVEGLLLLLRIRKTVSFNEI